MLLADLAGASEGGKASAFGLQVGGWVQTMFSGFFWGGDAAPLSANIFPNILTTVLQTDGRL